jgi:hypothetical protein
LHLTTDKHPPLQDTQDMRAALLVALCSPLLGAQAFVPPAGVYSQRELVAQTAVRHTSPSTSSGVAQGHVCSTGCPCARRRRQLLQWATADDDEEPATEESEEEVQEGALPSGLARFKAPTCTTTPLLLCVTFAGRGV